MKALAKIRHCKACGEPGHRSDSERCPNRRPPVALVVVPPPTVAPVDRIAEIATLREARDAIDADIVRLEDVRATVEERLAEAYEHRAKLDVRIRELRGGSPP